MPAPPPATCFPPSDLNDPKFKGLSPHTADLARNVRPETGRTDPETLSFDPNKGPGAFPSSRLDSHQNFEPDGMIYVQFRQFPTRVRIGKKIDWNTRCWWCPTTHMCWCPTIHMCWWCPATHMCVCPTSTSRWETTFGFLRVLGDPNTPGGGPLVVSSGCQMGH